MKRLKQHPVLTALFAIALLVGGVGIAQAQRADPAPSDPTACPMMGEDGEMNKDMQAMMERCPMMQRMMEDGEGMSGMMGMMEDCPMMRKMMESCPMMGGMMHPDSTMQGSMRQESMMHGSMQSKTGESSTSAVVEGGVQTAAVTVGPDGFAPKEVRLQAGVPARLVFKRTTDRTCATEVQIPAFGVGKTALPLGEEVVIAFTPEEAGTFDFSCGMDMMRGALVVTS
jgi:hypothetical protein